MKKIVYDDAVRDFLGKNALPERQDAKMRVLSSREKVMLKRRLLTFGKGDLIAVAAVLLLAVGTLCAYVPWQKAGETGVAQVYQQGELIRELNLNEDVTFTVGGEFENTISVSDGAIAFIKSTCPGTDCVHLGAASAPGRTLVCLPNRVEIRIVPAEGQANDDGVDFVVR